MSELSKYEQRLSRFLSLVLRHKPDAAGVTLDREGWVDIDTLIEGCCRNGNMIDRAQLDRIVEFNDKKRFTVEGKRIRAAQGHSFEGVQISYEPVQPPSQLFHGTATRFLSSIMRDGLQKMNRAHVHLSADLGTAKKVGSRHGSVVVIPVEAGAMYRDGFKFYQADNGVWLTDNVHPAYFGVLIYG